MSTPPLVSCNLGTVALESVLYGIFLMLSGTFMYLHFTRAVAQRSGSSVIRKYITPVFFGSVFVTCTVTGHWVMTIYRLFDAFVNFHGGAAPLLYYENIALTTEAVKTAFLIATLIVCDILFIYRLWVVWSYNYYVTVIPCLAVLGLCIAGPGIVYKLTQVATGNSVFISSLSQWIQVDYSCTFIHEQRVLATIVESAALYTTYVAFFFGCYQATSNLQYVAVDTLGTIAGIAFMMINVRVGLGWAQQAHPSTSSGIPSRRVHTAQDRSYVMQPVAVDISKVVQSHDDMGMPVGMKSELSV
ncbi:uncharacterized protein B0H18DRAFT_1084865 [Fomitopsis serialis]|uniref:uncharacterized protein n=1 Tax=Fomitopsis serialis TaxID=139415 RepID=UPI002008BAE9|nr:uncharacterized protein B0H18DRAFT_1084865 [Neoantrodia serialis]KAH9926913.1 hypothetical protein B0H18DRAFT_1084865 [Neoantrodia serialis]